MIEPALRSEPTKYPELNGLLQVLVAGATGVLGGGFVGAYLVGSFAVGDADLHSDCDFIVVVRRRLTSEQETGLRALHREIFDRPGHWAKRLEGSYAPEDELRTLGGLGSKWLYLDNAHQEMEWSTHYNSLEHRWSLRERGVVVAGPDPTELVDEVGPEAIRDRMREPVQTFLPDLESWLRLDRIAWGQRYAVTTLCRMLYSIELGGIASKHASLVWAKDHLDPAWSRLIQQALHGWSLGWDPDAAPSADSVRETVAFAEYAKAWVAVNRAT